MGAFGKVKANVLDSQDVNFVVGELRIATWMGAAHDCELVSRVMTLFVSS